MNVLKDRRRRWKRRTLVELTPEVPDRGGDPAGEGGRGVGGRERLRREDDRLPRLQREVFLLRAQQGHAYTAIAAGLGITEGIARVHFHHAVKRLKAWVTMNELPDELEQGAEGLDARAARRAVGVDAERVAGRVMERLREEPETAVRPGRG